MDAIEMILMGTGVIHSLLLLLVSTEEGSLKDDIHRLEVDTMMKKHGYEIGDRPDIRDFVSWILNDEFKRGGLKGNKVVENKLKMLKDSMIGYLFTNLTTISNTNPNHKVFDVHKRLVDYIVQLRRLRQVIEPEVQFSNSKHTVSKKNYLAVKGFWIDDTGEKVRRFTRSLGRTEDYPNWKDDPKVKTLGIETIRQVLTDEYNSIYMG